MHYDAQLVRESEGRLPNYGEIAAPTPLLGGSNSRLLCTRHSTPSKSRCRPRGELNSKGPDNLAPDNTAQPGRVTAALTRFFGNGCTIVGHDARPLGEGARG